MIRPPPRSPLFPYTTLSRSLRPPLGQRGVALVEELADVAEQERLGERRGRLGLHVDHPHPAGTDVAHQLHQAGHVVDRSEEHTSELQSRQYLVCRLLLEKKK